MPRREALQTEDVLMKVVCLSLMTGVRLLLLVEMSGLLSACMDCLSFATH